VKHWAWGGALLALLWAVGAFALGYERVFMPGELSDFHTSEGFAREAARAFKGSECRACHAWNDATFDNRCIACHPEQEHLIPRHRPENLAKFPALAGFKFTCVACHTEHRGRKAQPKRVTNASCENCHFHKHQADEHEWWKSSDVPTSKPSIVQTSKETCVDCHAQHGEFQLDEK
jgi:nitrate/TMAO reductase-like tetraheme cytochrome c subunit